MRQKKRDYDKEYDKRKSVQICISVTTSNFNIIKKNNSRSGYINRCIDYYESKHKTPEDKINELKEEKRQLAQEMQGIAEKIGTIEFKLEARKKKK